MNFKKRLITIFLTIIILPLFFTTMAMVCIGTYINSQNSAYGNGNPAVLNMNWAVQSYGKVTDELSDDIKGIIEKNPSDLEDMATLNRLSDSIENGTSYIIVRKNEDLYYAGNKDAANQLFDRLPGYGCGSEDMEAGYYFNDMQKFVKQFDFTFSDGSQGSIFIITKVTSLISKKLMIDMFIAIIVILMFTGFMLTRWLYRSMIVPMNTLNKAMQSIAEGNFEYRISTTYKGEVGELYKNYDDMRLRLKESADEKIHQEEQNRELISNISHDLKTPITAIKGYVEGIMDGVADTPEKVDKYMKTIYTKAIDMDRLINELTTYSKLNSNRIPYNFHRINLAEYFDDCRADISLELESKNIVLNYSNLVSADALIIADPEQLKRVVNNIVSNSLKYMDKKDGVIDIRILDEVDSVRVEIEDNGKGISARDLPNIFERFYRTDASRNSSKGGSGIGLSIVKKIIEDHGGYIWATSKEGEGTCMHFVLRKYTVTNE